MPRKSTTKSTDTNEVATETVATSTNVAVDNDTVKETAKRAVKKPLDDYEEIEVVSIVPNVSYKDSKTNDMYEWDNIGHVEYMTVETLKNMWRNHKGYFRNLQLKPMDDRIIYQFGLTKLFHDYEYLMNETNYNRDNIDDICETISKAHNGLKYAVCAKIKSSVDTGTISDIAVIKTLDRRLNLDLTSSL